jgi:hypothetical protein
LFAHEFLCRGVACVPLKPGGTGTLTDAGRVTCYSKKNNVDDDDMPYYYIHSTYIYIYIHIYI